VIQYWTKVDSDLESRVAQGISGASGHGRATASVSGPVGSGASTGL
jgi:hypothetical protein